MNPEGFWNDDDDAESLPTFDGLDELLGHVPTGDDSDDDAGWGTRVYGSVAGQDEVLPDASFTVSNPSGTLSATVGVGGRLRRIDVTDVSRLDEVQLSEQIVEMAALASEKARAAQHEVTVELMRRLGQDGVGVSAFLVHSIGLPNHKLASAHMAEAFSARYWSHDG